MNTTFPTSPSSRQRLNRDDLNLDFTTCPHCEAILFKGEKQQLTKIGYLCCSGGQVPLNVMKVKTYPFISELCRDKDFRKNIRRYNGLFSFCSSAINLDQNLANSKSGIYTFKVKGRIHHSVTTDLSPLSHQKPRFAQL